MRDLKYLEIMKKHKRLLWYAALFILLLSLVWNGASLRLETDGVEIVLTLESVKNQIKSREHTTILGLGQSNNH